MSRPRGFAARRPRLAARVLIRRAEQVLAEYEEHWPLTVRQIFYRLIAQHGYGKSKAFEHQLYDIMNRARRAGMILFDAIRDDGGIIKYRPCWASLNALVSAVAHTATDFHLERQAGQQRWLALSRHRFGFYK